MKLAEFKDTYGMPVLVAVDAIRVLRPNEENNTVTITFEKEHSVIVKGAIHDVLTALRGGIET